MRKIIIIGSRNAKALEEKAQDWLDSHSNCVILHVLQTMDSTMGYFITIIYQEP